MSRLKTEALLQYDSVRSLVENSADHAVHPIAVMFHENQPSLMVVCEWRLPDEELIVLEKLRAYVREMDVTGVAFICTQNCYLKEGLETLFYSVSVYEKDKPTWTHGETYFVMEGKVVWGEQFCSDTVTIAAKVLDLWN